jgi:hypothetical protein
MIARGFLRRLPPAVAGLLLIAALPARGQAADPFESNPGPPPAPRPAPQHAPRYVPRSQPAPEPALPPPAPVVVTPPPPDPAKRFEGTWLGRYSCGAGKTRPAFGRPVIAQIRGYQLTSIETGTPGTPGVWLITGTVSGDGDVSMMIEGVANGSPATAYSYGDRFTRRLRGRIVGEELNAADVDAGRRACGIKLARRR